MAAPSKYSCETAAKTLEWITAITEFIKPYTFLTSAHVVNFFLDRLWETVDKEWMDCLRNESVENLLLIPSGVVQDHWPTSLKEFVYTSRSLVFPQEQADLHVALPYLDMIMLNSVVTQGMNLKKKHEVECLSAVVSSVAKHVKADLIVDVGSGQGYLAQVLSFQYDHSVVAIDACSHHGRVTDARAERIRRHYVSRMQKSQSAKRCFKVPRTVTCRVISPENLKALADASLTKEDVNQPNFNTKVLEEDVNSSHDIDYKASLILAGLHACGDLSVTMIKTFSECREVKAVVSIGCCYNLLSEGLNNAGSNCGFPMSCGVNKYGLELGKNSCDLACQSAERWRNLGEDDGLHNFELHSFRAALQMVLSEHFPEVLINNPSIGRQGKALRRQQKMRTLEDSLHQDGYKSSRMSPEATRDEISSVGDTKFEENKNDGNYTLFEKFCQAGLCRLGLNPQQDINFRRTWRDIEPFVDLVGPYWSLRAALGPLLETLILLDRLLFLQEQGESIQATMLPIFEPGLSPRNVAIIAMKVSSNLKS